MPGNRPVNHRSGELNTGPLYLSPMNSRFSQASYPLGLALFALLLAFYKAASLMTEMGGGGFTLLSLVGLDALFLSLLFIVALLQSYIRPKILSITLWLLLFCMTLFYLVDSFVLLALNEHASLFEIGRYAPEWGVVLSFFDSNAYFAILLLLVSTFVFLKSSPAVKRFGLTLLAVALVSTGLSAVSAPRPLRFYAMFNTHELFERVGSRQAVTSYSTSEVQFYAALKREAVTPPPSKPDIILLIVESLSSINSKKVSGSPGLLDAFDKLAEEGVLFRNFFANHQASEGGLIALLGGFPPMHFPTATPYMFDEFTIQKSAIAQYRQQGYIAEFLTNADLAFIGLDHFLNGLGLDRSRGRDDVEAMRLAPRVVQDAPSDAHLYHEALLTVGRLMASDQPFLLTIATTSTHLPYTHPSGGADTEEAVWEWSMQQLVSFYLQLSETGYFENGILLVTGDHRQMRPITDVEIERYGASARARVPLLAIGNNYTRGRIDNRFFQQSDLLRMLWRIEQDESSLSPQPIWVERYNRKYGRIELINNLSIFDEADQGRHEYRIKVPGNRVEWLDKRPGFARRVETGIHTQRSLHQQTRSRVKLQADESY
ncbi:MAG: sulfatase-like hydrolase/transferase [Xanthomonadales bacterium]|nr:sulfatase-like hydrolase/transferase [Xanthomonadales bacterium]